MATPSSRLPAARAPASRSARKSTDGELAAGEPTDGVGALVRDTYLAFKHAIHEQLRAHRITTAQWVFLRMLWHKEGLNQKELSASLRTHPSTTVSALHLLERNGYVRRERSDTDRRNAHVFLTPKGRALEKKLLPHAAQITGQAVRGMSRTDVDTLKKLLLQVQHNLDAARGD